MASVNKAIILGNLGRDPEVRYMQDGKAVANLSIATTESWKDQSGQKQERTEWHRVVIFGPVAEVAEKYLKKGDSAYFEGKIKTRKWQDKDGKDQYSTEVVIDRDGVMQMLGSRGGSGGSASSGGGDGYDYNQDKPASTGAANKPKPVSDDEPFDDDIPF